MKSIQLKPDLPTDSCFETNHEPLYKRLPKRDENGNYLSDFMVLIPGLRSLSSGLLQSRLSILHSLLEAHPDVVFADLNTPLNLLWVSVRARHGVITDVAGEIRRQLPEARLVGHTLLPGPEKSGRDHAGKGLRWLDRARARLTLRKPG